MAEEPATAATAATASSSSAAAASAAAAAAASLTLQAPPRWLVVSEPEVEGWGVRLQRDTLLRLLPPEQARPLNLPGSGSAGSRARGSGGGGAARKRAKAEQAEEQQLAYPPPPPLQLTPMPAAFALRHRRALPPPPPSDYQAYVPPKPEDYDAMVEYDMVCGGGIGPSAAGRNGHCDHPATDLCATLHFGACLWPSPRLISGTCHSTCATACSLPWSDRVFLSIATSYLLFRFCLHNFHGVGPARSGVAAADQSAIGRRRCLESRTSSSSLHPAAHIELSIHLMGSVPSS